MGQTAMKLTALRERQARIHARIEKLENESKKQARKDDTRLKILVGATMLADADKRPETSQLVRTVLARALTLPRDREFVKSKGWL